ncbi:helix-hairpin-helix domain-containing protein [Shewanella mangrovisoli]|uniref:helix-hairpin-helix domain-containing protein n=1 Tax=Shewanella TaxID=22 RepID=UPI00005E0056|nr:MULTISPECIES: helix-hairpin-helix domain-containing protein [unclassified Shewanella]ABK46719.1 putative mitomycin resistance protein [Shewanella sp. ANA-3]MDH0447090.1 helix-hairpin-helix domain-containing protein [Shewanella sp. GD04112]
MNPAKVVRNEVKRLTDLPNIGKACAADLRLLGIESPEQLLGQDPYEMYSRINRLTGQIQDPCMLDVFISVTRFMAGDDPKPWWYYTEERKQALTQL